MAFAIWVNPMVSCIVRGMSVERKSVSTPLKRAKSVRRATWQSFLLSNSSAASSSKTSLELLLPRRPNLTSLKRWHEQALALIASIATRNIYRATSCSRVKKFRNNTKWGCPHRFKSTVTNPISTPKTTYTSSKRGETSVLRHTTTKTTDVDTRRKTGTKRWSIIGIVRTIEKDKGSRLIRIKCLIDSFQWSSVRVRAQTAKVIYH